jgi:predicted Rossmann-fold nucleotide-binding protein
LFDVNGFWQPFVDMLEHCIAEGFLDSALRNAFVRAPDADVLIEALMRALPPGRSVVA